MAQMSYKGLEEAIDAILRESDDHEFDMANVSPDPSVLTDEDEGDEEDMATSSTPYDVPGATQVFTKRADGGNRDCSSDNSDDEPLLSKRRRQDFTRMANMSPIVHRTPTSQCTSEVFDKENTVREQLRGLNPVQIFKKLRC